MRNPRPPEPPQEEEATAHPKKQPQGPIRGPWTIRGMSLNDGASRAGGGTSDVPVYERALRAVSLRPVF